MLLLSGWLGIEDFHLGNQLASYKPKVKTCLMGNFVADPNSNIKCLRETNFKTSLKQTSIWGQE